MRTIAAREGVSEGAIRARYRTVKGLERAIAEHICRDALNKAIALVDDDKSAPPRKTLNDWAVQCYHATLWAEKKKKANAAASQALAAEARRQKKVTPSQ